MSHAGMKQPCRAHQFMTTLLNHPLLKQESKSLYWWKAGLKPLSHDWQMTVNHPYNHLHTISVQPNHIKNYILKVLVGAYAHSRYSITTKPYPESMDSFIFEI